MELLVTISPRLAVIGAGPIAQQHALVGAKAGMSVTAVLTTSQSRNLTAFLELAPEAESFTSVLDLVRFAEWDCAVIATNVDNLAPLGSSLGSSGKPILLEKPGASSSAQLKQMRTKESSTYLAYNRRFFRPVQLFRESLEKAPEAHLEVDVPEAIFDQKGVPTDIDRILTNTVHQLDLVTFFVGRIDSWDLRSYESGYRLPILHLIGESVQGHPVTIRFRWNAAALTRFSFDWRGTVQELRPMETLSVYDHISINRDRAAEGIRIYSPALQYEAKEEAGDFKPGFLAQMFAFRDAVLHPNERTDLASLTDGCLALEIAESVLDYLKLR